MLYHKMFMIIFTVAMTTDLSRSDPLLDVLKSKYPSLDKVPKAWFGYLEMFLSVKHRQSISQHSMLHFKQISVCQAETFMTQAKSFVENQLISNRSWNESCHTQSNTFCQNYHNHSQITCCSKWYFTGYTETYSPTGNFEACHSDRYNLWLYRDNPYHLSGNTRNNAGWVISLGSKQLALNISMTHIFVPVRSRTYCKQRNIHVHASEDQSFVYCGKLSHFNLYIMVPKKLYIGAYFLHYGFYQVNGFYSVMDSNVLKTHATPPMSELTPVPVHTLHNTKHVFLEYITAEKGRFITVHVTYVPPQDIFAVFDGPNLFSLRAKRVGRSHIVTNFQCTILTSLPVGSVTYTTDSVDPHKKQGILCLAGLIQQVTQKSILYFGGKKGWLEHQCHNATNDVYWSYDSDLCFWWFCSSSSI